MSKAGLIPIMVQVNPRKGKPYVTKKWIRPEDLEQKKKKTRIKPTSEIYKKDGKYITERARLHKRIVYQTLVNCSFEKGEGKKPTCILLLGGAASGKSTVVKNFIGEMKNDQQAVIDGKKFGILNADDIKDQLPEYDKYKQSDVLRAASSVHKESSDIGKFAFHQITNRKGNFIYDGTMGNTSKSLDQVKELQSKGYNVKLVGVTVDVQDAIDRANSRAFGDKWKGGEKEGSGRFVSDDILAEGHSGGVETFKNINDLVDEIELYDNNVPFGEAPKKIFENGKILDEKKYNDFLSKPEKVKQMIKEGKINKVEDYYKVEKSFFKNIINKARSIVGLPTLKVVNEQGRELSDEDIAILKAESYFEDVVGIESQMEYISEKLNNLEKSYETELKKSLGNDFLEEKIKDRFENKERGLLLDLKSLNIQLEKAEQTLKQNRVKYADSIVRNSEGKVLLLYRSSHESNPSQYSLPGGHVDEGETFKEACLRELLEETNIEAEDAYLCHIKETSKAVIHYFDIVVDAAKAEQIILDNDEHFNYEWAGRDDLDKLDCVFDLADMLKKYVFGENEVEKAFQVIQKAFDNNQISEEKYFKAYEAYQNKIEKGRQYQIGEISQTTGLKKVGAGVWVDPDTGKRVKKDDQKGGKNKKQEDTKNKNYSDEELRDYAKNASEEDLNNTIKTGDNPKMREAAHEELDRRKKEESKEEKEKDTQTGTKDKKGGKNVPEQDGKESNWFDGLHEKYELNKLPIGVPEKDIEIDLSEKNNWVMKWVDPKTEKTAYAYPKEFLEKNAQNKWKRISSISSEQIAGIKEKSLSLLGDKENSDAAAIVAIIAHTGLRPSSRAGFKETQNRGVTTLAKENVKIKGSKVEFEFTGKSYKHNTAEIDNQELADYLTEKIKYKKDGDFVFDVDVNKARDLFKKEISDDKKMKLKDMRTYVATDMAREILYKDDQQPPPLPERIKDAKKLVQDKLKNVFKKVSEQLNNSPAMAKSSYVHPNVIENWLKTIGALDMVIKAENENDIGSLDDDLKDDDYLDERDYFVGYDVGNLDVDQFPLPDWWEEDEGEE